MTRMACISAMQMQVQLPETAQRMLDVLGESAWDSSDLLRLRSDLPSADIGVERTDMEKLLWQWQSFGIQQEVSRQQQQQQRQESSSSASGDETEASQQA